MKTLSTVLVASFVALATLAGCSASQDSLSGGGGPGGPGGGDDPSADPNTPPTTGDPNDPVIQQCAATQKKYVGFGGVDLTAERAMAISGEERQRVKPYSALQGEIPRVLGNTPPSLGQSASAFAAPPDRWYAEAQGSAVTLYTTYRIAFEGALTYVATDAKYAAAPTDTTAAAECNAFIRKAWSRSASSAEIDACKKMAVTDSTAETDARRRWAYTFASIMTATGFTTY